MESFKYRIEFFLINAYALIFYLNLNASDVSDIRTETTESSGENLIALVKGSQKTFLNSLSSMLTVVSVLVNFKSIVWYLCD